MRRYRERHRRAGVLIEFEVVGTALEDLVPLGWLDPGVRQDAGAVSTAIIGLAERAAKP